MSRHGIEASRSAQRTLDAPVEKYPVGQGSAVAAVERSDIRRSLPHSLSGTDVPTAEPCLPARAGVRGLAPGVRSVHGAVRYAALGTSRPMARNSSSRARLARRFASRSDIAWATSSRPAKVVPGFRKRSASGSDLSFS